MADGTAIEWADASWNPIRARTAAALGGRIGWHCEIISPGCEFCYAAAINRRLGTGMPYLRQRRDAAEIFVDEKILAQPLHWRRPRRIFVCSMSDLFGEWVSDAMIARVFAVAALCPQHQFLVLTKRAERMREYFGALVCGDGYRSYVSRPGWHAPDPRDQDRGRERHLAPLQFDIADRLITQFSMPGELVFDPFGGLGTVPYCAIKQGRRGLMVELSPEHWRDACAYLSAAEAERAAPNLFSIPDAAASKEDADD